MSKRTLAVAAAVIGGGLLVLYVVLWLEVSGQQIGRSDFTSTYMGATLWVQGHHGDLYNLNLQSRLHASLIAPDTEGNLPFVNPPLAAVVASPLTALSLDNAYRVWSVLQVAMLVAAVVIAWRATGSPRVSWHHLLLCLALPGTLALLLLGQWDGISALGLALGYAMLRTRRRVTAGAILAVTLLLAKPHLALGMAALVIGWRERRVILGAASAAVILAVLNLAAVGTSGVRGWISIQSYDASRWALQSLLGFNGFFASWIHSSSAAQILGWAGISLALLAALWIGHRRRQGSISLELALAGATVLTLLASPHLLEQDLVLLSPALVWLFAWARQCGDQSDAMVFGGALLLLICEFADWGNQNLAPPGRLVPVALTAAGLLLMRAAMKSSAGQTGHVAGSGVGGSVA